MPTPRHQPPWEAAFALQTAAEAVAQLVPRNKIGAREQLRVAVRRAVHQLMTGRTDHPPRDIAIAYFREAMDAALKAGVARSDLVVAFNGDDER